MQGQKRSIPTGRRRSRRAAWVKRRCHRLVAVSDGSVVPIAPQRQEICLDCGRETSPSSAAIGQEIVENQRHARLVGPCGREAVGQARVVPSKGHGTYGVGKRCEPRPCYRQQDVGRLRLAPGFEIVLGKARRPKAGGGIHDFATRLAGSIDASIDGLGLEKPGPLVNGGHDFRGSHLGDVQMRRLDRINPFATSRGRRW
jgi:hypothetical protein